MFESIILIGPGNDLFPLINNKLQVSNLPILNKPLLEYNIEFLLPVSKRIFIVILEENVNNIENIVLKYKEKIKVVGINSYNGIVESIKNVNELITSDNIIVTKGDLITNIDIVKVVDRYFSSKAFFLTIISETTNEGVSVGFKDDQLLFYNAESLDELPKNIFKNGPVTLSKELDTVQFYMFNKMALSMFEENIIRFKHSLLPKIVEQLREVRPVVLYSQKDAYIYQIRDKDRYFKANIENKSSIANHSSAVFDKSTQKEAKQYIKKHNLKDIGNFLGNSKIGDNCIIINSVVGNNVEIGDKSRVFSSVIMNDVIIGEGSTLDNCMIGVGVIIKPFSSFVNCVFSPGFQFKADVKAENELFNMAN